MGDLMTGLRSIGLRMFRWRSKRRVISVTRRHIDFLFNREETVMTAEAREYRAVVRTGGEVAKVGDRILAISDPFVMIREGEGDYLLPPSDESKVGDDV